MLINGRQQDLQEWLNEVDRTIFLEEYFGGPVGTQVDNLVSSGLPMVLQSSGTVGNNGALSGLTALNAALGPCYCYFPTGALYAGSTAGFYYTNLTSTTAGTVYANTWTGGTPAIPVSPTPIVATGPGAYTQTVSTDIIVASFPIPGGLLGNNGGLMIFPVFAANNTAGAKVYKILYGGATVASQSLTAVTIITYPASFQNCGQAGKQATMGSIGFTANNGVQIGRFSVDSAVDQNLVITVNIAVATDFMLLQFYKAAVFL